MEPITLITAALALAQPFLIKTGEKFAESVGEDIWKWIKKPFSKEEEQSITTDLQTELNKEKLITLLLDKINSDSNYKLELEAAVVEAQKKIATNNKQIIQNYAPVEKQINIQNINGNITF